MMSSPWSVEELTETVVRANQFVRHLLWELTQKPEVDSADVKSPNTAFAIISRMAKRAGRDPLVQRKKLPYGRTEYTVHPAYRDLIKDLVSEASDLPTPKEPRRPATPRPRTGDSGGAQQQASRNPSRGRSPGRPRHQKSISLPPDIALEYWRDLIAFLNATPDDRHFRIILDGEELLLEAS